MGKYINNIKDFVEVSWLRVFAIVLAFSAIGQISFGQNCDFLDNEMISVNSTGGNQSPDYTTSYALVTGGGMIIEVNPMPNFMPQQQGTYLIFAVNYLTSEGVTNLSPGNNISTVVGSCIDISAPLEIQVCVDCSGFNISLPAEVEICQGESITLVPTGGGAGTSYQWNTAETTQSITVQPSVSTTYMVLATRADGQCSSQASVDVTVLDVPQITVTNSATDVICPLESATVSVAVPNGASVLWSNGSTMTSITESPAQTTTYRVTVTGSNGCVAVDSATVEVQQQCDLCVTLDCPDLTECSFCEGEEVTFTATGGNTALTTKYVLTDDFGIIIDTFSTEQIGPQPVGIGFVFPINYDESRNLAGLEIGQSIFDVTGDCFDLGDPYIFRVCSGPDLEIESANGQNQICNGGSITLQATTAPNANVLWSTGEVGLSITVSPTSTTVYTAEVTNLTGCTTTADFTVTIVDCSQISGVAWEDLNGDGLNSGGEPRLPNVQVNLYFTSDSSLVDTDVTDAAGQYVFDELIDADYYLEFIGEDGFEFTFQMVGSNTTIDSDPSMSTGRTDVISIQNGEGFSNVDAGFYRCAQIGEFVWYDTDEDDFRDFIENGINGLEVQIYRLVNGTFELYDVTHTTLKPGTPSTDGYFSFCVPPGEYYVSIDLPPFGLVPARKDAQGFIPLSNPNEQTRDNDLNFEGRSDVFMVSSGDVLTNIGAGYYPMATAGNLVWMDQNGNGAQDPSEGPVADVRVELFDAVTNTKIDETLTGSDGTYYLDRLQATSYYLRFTPPEGLLFTYANAASELLDSDVDDSNGLRTTSSYTFNPGENNPNIDAGVVQASILPVDWLTVDAVRVNDQYNRVTWSTASEVNTSHFIVQRSLNGRQDWVAIGEVEASGNTSGRVDYSLDDRNSEAAAIYYYRIEQVDLDGRSEFSERVSVRVDDMDTSISIYPNPTADRVQIEYFLPQEQVVDVTIFDSTGKLVEQVKLDAQGDRSWHTGTVDLADYVGGIYTLQIALPSGVVNKNIILMK